MNRISRLTALLLALLMVFQVVPASAETLPAAVSNVGFSTEELDAAKLNRMSENATAAVAALDTVVGMGVTPANQTANLRKQSHVWSDILAVIPADTLVKVYDSKGISFLGEWYKVNYNGQDGYVHNTLLSLCACNVAEGAGLDAHADNCPDKRYYRELCALTAEEIYAGWADYTAEGKAFILLYLSWTDQAKLAALRELTYGQIRNAILAATTLELLKSDVQDVYGAEALRAYYESIENAEELAAIDEHLALLYAEFLARILAAETLEEVDVLFAFMTEEERAFYLAALTTEQYEQYKEHYLALGGSVEVTVEATYNGMEFAFTGEMPANAQIEVKDVSEIAASFVSDNFAVSDLGAGTLRKTYAFDMKITVDGEEWQPNDKVEITIDGIGMDGERIADHVVIHHLIDSAAAIQAQKDQEVSKYGVLKGENLNQYFSEETAASGSSSEIYYEELDSNYADVAIHENGSVSFSVDSFSDFYFTVDFAFNGEKYVIPGGSSILLSELFDVLGIDKAIEDVIDVYFEDENFTLVGIHKQENGDWLLTADEAFTTEELLIITFSDGTVLQIVVTDAVKLTGSHTTGTKTYKFNPAGGDGYYSGIGPEGFKVTGGHAIFEIYRGINGFDGSVNVQGGTLEIKYANSYEDKGSDLKRTAENTLALFNVSGGTLKITGSSSRNMVISGACYFEIKNGEAIKTQSGGNAIVAERPLIAVSGGTVDLDYVTLTANWNDGTGTEHSYSTGSAIRMNCSNPGRLTMDNCTISSCYSYQQGPALAFNATAASSATIRNTLINGCYTGIGAQGGGTIRSVGTNMCTLELSGCRIYDNYTLRGGGAIAWNSMQIDPLKISGCRIYNNVATGSGGGVSCASKIMISNGTKIYNNRTSASGGGMYINVWGSFSGVDPSVKERIEDSNGSVELDNTVEIYGNTAGNNGGGIFFEVDKQIKAGTDPNAEAHKKWVIDKYTMNLTLDGAQIYNNTAGQLGGGIAIMKKYQGYDANLKLNAGTVSNNTAGVNGGGIYANRIDVNIGTDASIFTISGNTSTGGNGGGLALVGAGLNGTGLLVKNATIKNNIATSGYGGGVYVEDYTEPESGNVYKGLLSIQGGIVTENSAKYGGGYAVRDTDNQQVRIIAEAGSINKNTATKCGGGIYMSGDKSSMTTTGGNIEANTAATGGGIYLIDGANLTVDGGYITGNTAVGTGSSSPYQQNEIAGVGGGIAVANGASATQTKIFVEGQPIGVYGNTADYAANDVFASGKYTQLDLPSLEDMEITDNEYNSLTGWYEDYATDDTNYESHSLRSNPNITRAVRYKDATTTVRAYVDADEQYAAGFTLDVKDYINDTNAYVCITLGVTKVDSGTLRIQKVFDDSSVDYEGQVFIFKVTGADLNGKNPIELLVRTVGSTPVEIKNLLYGTYKVEEITDHAWRYEYVSGEKTVTLNESKTSEYVQITNKLINDKWLDHDFVEKNVVTTVTGGE